MPPIPNSLSELLAAALAKKHKAIRDRLGIPPELQIEPFQLEGLGYHLGDRSGAVEVRFRGDTLYVREPDSTVEGIGYRGHAAHFLLAAWDITPEQAHQGFRLEVLEGKRVK